MTIRVEESFLEASKSTFKKINIKRTWKSRGFLVTIKKILRNEYLQTDKTDLFFILSELSYRVCLEVSLILSQPLRAVHGKSSDLQPQLNTPDSIYDFSFRSCRASHEVSHPFAVSDLSLSKGVPEL